MGQQIASGTPGEFYTKGREYPTFTNFVVMEWDPSPLGDISEQTEANGDSVAKSKVNSGESVEAKFMVKDGQAVPADFTVHDATFTGPTTKKYIFEGVKSARDGAVLVFTATLTYRDSMTTPAAVSP